MGLIVAVMDANRTLGSPMDGLLQVVSPRGFVLAQNDDSNGLDPLEAALAGGDDYELLVAVSRAHRRRFAAVTRLARGVPITHIGELTKDRALVLRTREGDRALPAGYEHFKTQEAGGRRQETGEA